MINKNIFTYEEMIEIVLFFNIYHINIQFLIRNLNLSSTQKNEKVLGPKIQYYY